jgi:two-component system, OmpR family, osmolarity sensor histidine kinase EnvZ
MTDVMHEAGKRLMTTLDAGMTLARAIGDRLRRANAWLGRSFKSYMPSGLYARALLIIIVPMVLLQSVVAFVFMERHWNTVTQRLSAAVVQDIGALIDIYKAYPQDKDRTQIRTIAQQRLGLLVDFLPVTEMPPPGPKPFFSLLDQTLSVQLRQRIGLPFWVDTVGRSSLVEIRIKLDDAVMRVVANRSAAYASNSEIFLLWMVGTSLVLITVAVLFLRNQIRPILRLADAAESFGKGREAPNFRPRGASEVRRAAQAFIEMKGRIERTMEQRTAMLAGVSHDLRTILTRFKLELALIGDGPDVDNMRRDVDEMNHMLEDYLAFARGDSGEQAERTDIPALLEELRSDAERHGHKATVTFQGQPVVTLKIAAFKRCLANLVTNATRHADTIAITGHRDHRWLTVTIDDDGPGIPQDMREEVFKPFLRLDHARNQDHGGTGLGLAITRDIARSHGGDVTLGDSPLGGLRATVRVPV